MKNALNRVQKSGSYSDTESLNFLQVTNRLISENEKEMKLKDNF